jgi:outer membrane protein OmpA-like peptidoglycan-associated protein
VNRIRILLCLALLLPGRPLHALTLDFPGPVRVTAQVQDPAGSTAIATGPWRTGGMQTRQAEGALDRTAYRIEAAGLSTLQMLAPLRDQLVADGYTVIYQCEANACGGFDFRFGLAILPEPDMHVDMGDYRYLSAERQTPAGDEVIDLLISRSANAGFVQVTRVGGALPPVALTVSSKAPADLPAPPALTPDPAPAPVTLPGNLATALETGGAVALDDLVFGSGSATLADGDYASLAALGAYLKANPARTIAFVGHTDASGGLETNIALSRQRAEAVRAALIARFDVPPAQVQAEGVGYLSPRASNLTPEGRAANRRVEVMLTSTE